MAEKRAPQGRISMHARDSKLNELVGRTRDGMAAVSDGTPTTIGSEALARSATLCGMPSACLASAATTKRGGSGTP
jgi:hypothetical protein